MSFRTKALSIIVCMFILFLSGCDISSTNENKNGNEQIKTNTSKEENTNKDVEENLNESLKEELTDEKDISYQLHGKSMTETAKIIASDNQDFSLFVLPTYDLTAEEPAKDILYFKEDDSHFMRIELLPPNTSIDDAVNTVKDQLTAVDNNVMNVKSDEAWLANAHIYQAKNQTDEVTACLIYANDFLLKLTVFTKIENNHLEPFFKMAETIKAN